MRLRNRKNKHKYELYEPDFKPIHQEKSSFKLRKILVNFFKNRQTKQRNKLVFWLIAETYFLPLFVVKIKFCDKVKKNS